MKFIFALFIGCIAFVLLAADVPSEKFVRIPANPDFTFAAGLNQHSRENGEKSPILKPYCLAKYPVTNAEYKEFTDATKHRTPRYWKNGNYPAGKGSHPVLYVSLDDAQSYCKWIGEKHSGWTFRLPTEAEWENAASGPPKYAFPWGNSQESVLQNGLLKSKFNFNGVVAAHYLKTNPNLIVTFYHQKSTSRGKTAKLSEVISFTPQGGIRGWINHRDYTGFVYTDLFKKLSDEGGYTTPVTQYPDGKSFYGCFDMAGNSWDWTSSEITAANGAERGKVVNAIRGGSWYANANSCKAIFRGEGRRAQGAYNTVGFRLAAEPKQ